MKWDLRLDAKTMVSVLPVCNANFLLVILTSVIMSVITMGNFRTESGLAASFVAEQEDRVISIQHA